MNFIDRVDITGTQRRQSDGALMVDARVARTGIQLYTGSEVGKPEMPVVRVFRPAEEVFSADTLATFAHRPVTNDHPHGLVTADTWKRSNVVGHTADEVNVAANDIYVRVPLMISDGDMINDISAGKRELSAGYTCDLDWTAGVTPTGEAFDATQRNIKINHIAVVRNGRAGSQVRIGDNMATKTIFVDAIPVTLEDQAAAIVEASLKRLNDALSVATAAIADRETQIGTLTADLATTKAQVPTQAALAQMIADRVTLETTVKAIAPAMQIDAAMTDAALRRAVVKDRFPTLVTDATSDAEVLGMFRTLQTTGTPTADTYRATGAPIHQLADNGHSTFESYVVNGWKN